MAGTHTEMSSSGWTLGHLQTIRATPEAMTERGEFEVRLHSGDVYSVWGGGGGDLLRYDREKG